jgi:nicotinamidase-related amidase
MPLRHHDLHGNVPDKADIALLIIDVINDVEFEGGDRLLEHALPMAQRIAALKTRARELGIPVVYVNDNFGKWQSDLKKLITHCLRGECRGKPIVELLHPADDDYFVLKPKHSGFFCTPLELVLKFLGAHRLILTGVAGNSCVLHTAADAHMRNFDLMVPRDCVASLSAEDNVHALQHMHTMLGADIRPSPELEFNPPR